MTFKYVELFAGIGGFRQALDRAGGECVFASEIDKFAAQAYEALYGEKPAGDITKIDATSIPDHDLLVGGFPCQAFSIAGRRGGFEDTRGTLFFEIVRIAREKKPRMMLLENVKGLVGHDKGRTLETMVTALAEIGYAVDFEVLNSKYFGVPQNRERIFIVAVRADAVFVQPWLIPKERKDVVARGKRRIQALEGVKTFNFDWPQQGEVTTRLRDILEDGVDERYYLSDEKTARLVAQLEERSQNMVAHAPHLLENEPQMLGHVDIKGHDAIKRVYSADHVGPTLTTMGGGHREPKIAEEIRPVLTPDRIKKRQNGRRFKDDGEEAFTLTSQDRHGVAIGKYPRYRIRKLTPRECWRLQGFPDEAHDAVKAAGISDSQRYKQAGNAVTVNVIEALADRLLPLLHEEIKTEVLAIG